MNTHDIAPNLASLEEVLASLHVLTAADHPALGKVLDETILVCRTRHAIRAGIQLQLQAAITCIRTGWPDDALAYLERANDILTRWTETR